jgi:outer membrane protein TolC
MRLRVSAFALVVAAAVSSPSLSYGADRLLSVDEAVDMALRSNARLLAAESGMRSDRDLQRSAGSRMLPSIHVADEAQHWDSQYGIPFGSTLFVVRDQNINTFAATADQPLSGLLYLGHERSAQERTADAGEAGYQALRAQVKVDVEVGFLHLFEAAAMEDIAKASEAELTEELQVTKAKVDAGVLTTADMLRVQVAVANAKQQEILAHTQGAVARANLLGAIGLPMDSADVGFAEPKDLLARGRVALPPGSDAEKQALAARPEIRQRRLQVEAADEHHSASTMAMGPRIDAEAGYNHLDGQPFSPMNAAYVGVKLDWPIWEWGTSYYAQRASGAQTEAAKYQLEDQRRQIGVEVATDLAQAQAAISAVDVAEQAITSAEEAYRVTGALLKAGSATTTDLLETQRALTEARLNRTRAQYEQAIAQANLARTLGR